MGAAKRLYDNDYNDRQETVVAAKAYLDNTLTKEVEVEAVVVTKKDKIRNNAQNLRSIVMSIIYFGIILALVLMPLFQETEIHRLKVGFSDYKNEINRLKEELTNVESQFAMKVQLANIEKRAKDELGLVRSSDVYIENIYSKKYFVLKDDLEVFDFDEVDLDDIADSK